MPNLTIPDITAPAQLMTLVGAIVGIVLLIGILTGIYFIADGMRSYGASKGNPKAQEQALNTARDGFVGAGVCAFGGVVIAALMVFLN